MVGVWGGGGGGGGSRVLDDAFSAEHIRLYIVDLQVGYETRNGVQGSSRGLF